MTNTVVKHEALIAGLKLAQNLRASKIKVLNDSKFVVNQVNDNYTTKDLKMTTYLIKVKKLIFEFVVFFI